MDVTLDRIEPSRSEVNFSLDVLEPRPNEVNSIEQIPRNGIDIREAMAILASRSNNGGENFLRKDTSDSSGEYTDDKKGLGQSIELFTSKQEWTNMNGATCPCAKSDQVNKANTEQIAQLRDANDFGKHAEENRTKLKEKLMKTSTTDLLRLVINLQRDRVATYNIFDDALQEVLDSGGKVSNYPVSVASATATFAVLSDTVNVIREIFQDRFRSEEVGTERVNKIDIKQYIQWLCKLQQAEKQKLNFTAALHLEKIRRVTENEISLGSSSSNILLHQSVKSLQQKQRLCMEHINDILEEIRYSLDENQME